MKDNKIYNLHLIDKYFDLIKKGIKTVEIRLNDEKRQKMNIGDYIEFINKDTEETILTIIKDKKIFDSLNDLYEIYDERTLGIRKDDINDVIGNIYSKEELDNNKICAIEIELK